MPAAEDIRKLKKDVKELERFVGKLKVFLRDKDLRFNKEVHFAIHRLQRKVGPPGPPDVTPKPPSNPPG